MVIILLKKLCQFYFIFIRDNYESVTTTNPW